MKKSLLFIAFGLFINFEYVQAQIDCLPSSASEHLDINNVKAHFSNTGLDWNNYPQYQSGYEVPKGSGIHSIYSGGMWIAGVDEEQNLKTNVRQYLQHDYEESLRPGPMNNLSPGQYVTADCADYDHIYKINRSDVELHLLYFEMLEANGGIPPTTSPFENGYEIPDNILNWPAFAEVLPGESQELAPFFDNDCCGGTENIYEPELGDYPAFRFPMNEEDFDCEKHLLGDQVLWWVVNDANGTLEGVNDDTVIMGIEVQNMAYAFLADDHLNNTTFLRRTVINRSGRSYSDVLFGQFIDVDIGGPNDDYVGTDVDRGMTYFYNGDNYDANDQTLLGYGELPPAIGFDFVGGPLADENDGIDNDFDGEVDEPGETLRADFALYYNNSGSTTNGNPNSFPHFYNYLRGIWKNGLPMTYGGDGTSDDPDAINCKFMFPGDSDPLLINTGGVPVDPWTEITSGNPPDDRRIIMSSGPFTLLSDEMKVFTLSIPWVREENCPPYTCTVELLKEANDLAQDLHDNCYEMPCMVLDVQFDVELNDGNAFFSSVITSGESYHWTFGDGADTTTTAPFANHTYANIENVIVCLEINYGCGADIMCDTLINLTTSLDEPDQSTTIELFPNPAKDQLHIQFSGFDQQPQEVQIFSLSGQLVKRETLNSNTQNTIDISSFTNGMYLLKVGTTDGNHVLHKRFVVVR